MSAGPDLLVVRLRDGGIRPLPPSLCSRAKLMRAAAEIRRFLGVPAALAPRGAAGQS